MKRYDTYKDSGERFAGKVPENWDRYRIKYLLSRSAAGVWGDDEKGDANDIVCFRIADFDYAHGGLKYDNLTLRNIEQSQRNGRMLSNGDLLIEKSGGGDATPVGRVVRFSFDEQAVCSNFIHSISVRNDFSNNFLYYYFYSLYANKENLLYFNQTTGIQNLKVGEYLGQSIYLPPLAEQEAIAAWLDVKCGEIDKLIATQQRRIELLQELRQSIITRAVTHGINPDAPMRPSGIDWIGDIPAHWEIGRMKFTGKFDNGLTYSPNDVVDDENGFLVLRSTNIQDNKLDFDDCVYVNSTPEELLVKNGDIIICSRNGSANLVGKCAIVDKDIEQMTFGAFMMRYRPYINSKYAFYMFQSATSYYKGLFSTTTINQLTKGIVSIMKAVVPPIAEQQEIVDYIERETAKVDAAIGKAERQIALLQELRQSVITEVVTGKRKVC